MGTRGNPASIVVRCGGMPQRDAQKRSPTSGLRVVVANGGLYDCAALWAAAGYR
jgi:hypothetical protein